MIQEIDVHELSARLAEGAPTLLLDVRQPWENEYAALPGSQLIPLPELTRRSAEIQPPADALIVVYCHHGIRSLQAAAFLEKAGIHPVVSLAGGIDAWSMLIDASMPRY